MTDQPLREAVVRLLVTTAIIALVALLGALVDRYEPAVPAMPTATLATAHASIAPAPDPVDPAPTTFTLEQLATGEVSATDYNRFWDARVVVARDAECPSTPAGSTLVTFDVGATPPEHLGDDYVDHAPRLAQARADAAARCS